MRPLTPLYRSPLTSLGRLALAAAAALFTLSSHAAQPAHEQAKAAFERKMTVKTQSVRPTPIPGLFEVVVDRKVMYTDKTGQFLVQGDIIDLNKNVNMTMERRNELMHVDVSILPKNGIVKTVNGNGSRVLYTFEDPNCGFCKRLTPQLEKVKDVTIITYPVAILGPDSLIRSQYTLCSSDPAKTWNQFMMGTVNEYGIDGACKSLPLVDRNTKLMSSLGFGGTPAIIFADGSSLPGYVEAKTIEARLAATAKKAGSSK